MNIKKFVVRYQNNQGHSVETIVECTNSSIAMQTVKSQDDCRSIISVAEVK